LSKRAKKRARLRYNVPLNKIFQVGNIKDITESCFEGIGTRDDRAMRIFLRHFKDRIKVPAFSSQWLLYSYTFLIVGQFLDGFTTKIGLDLGAQEVGPYAKVVYENYGFLGLILWKYAIVAALGAMYFIVYYVVKKYDPAHLKPASKMLTAGCLLAGMASFEVVVSNILQIELALHP
jgi:hypothetical protein